MNLGNNKISDRECILYLKELKYLKNLNLRGNPICLMPDYKILLQNNFKCVEIIDGID